MKNNNNAVLAFGDFLLLPLEGTGSIRERLLWLQKLRVYLFPCLVLLFLLGVRFHYVTSSSYSLLTIASVLYTVTFSLTQFFLNKGVLLYPKYLLINLILDLFTFSLFLLGSKGIANPFIYTIFIHAFIGGILLKPQPSLVFELIIHTTLFSIQYFSLSQFDFVWFDVLPLIFTQHLLCFFSWIISSSLASHLDSGFKQINNLKTANEKADRLRALGALASGFSHEFASPLNTIKLKLQRIERLNDSIVIKDDLRVLNSAVNKCDDTLKRMNSTLFDSKNIASEKVYVHDFVEKIINVWRQDKGIAVVENNISTSLILRLPVFNFTQIVLFIMDNSFEARRGDCNIRITSRRDDGLFTLNFYDNGKGFSMDVLERLGEPFNSDKKEGVGLGLFSADLFMTSIGGNLEVISQTDGACVQLKFPESLNENNLSRNGELV